jgi:lipocalin
MSSLVEKLGTEPLRTQVIADCVDLIDAQVKQKGFVMKSAYATIKAIKKSFVPEVVNSLLDDWMTKLQPHYDKWAVSKPSSFSDYIIARSDDVAEDLLSVTDARAEKTSHTTAKKMYMRMRDSAKKNVVEAIPELSKLVERHLNAAPQPTAATTA